MPYISVCERVRVCVCAATVAVSSPANAKAFTLLDRTALGWNRIALMTKYEARCSQQALIESFVSLFLKIIAMETLSCTFLTVQKHLKILKQILLWSAAKHCYYLAFWREVSFKCMYEKYTFWHHKISKIIAKKTRIHDMCVCNVLYNTLGKH